MEGPKNHLTNQHRSSTASCKTKLLASLSTAFILEPETDSKISPPDICRHPSPFDRVHIVTDSRYPDLCVEEFA